jgi:cytochrome P450
MSRLTLDLASKTLFGAEAADKGRTVARALRVLIDAFLARYNKLLPVPLWLPTPRNLRLRRAVRKLDRIIYGFVEQRKRSTELGTDLLSILLQARDEEDNQRMSKRQLRDEAMTLFLAGHETTALALSWAWYALARHPEIEERVAQEARRVLGDRAPTAEDWPKLVFTQQVVLETMRLYPPVYVVGREVLDAVEIGGYPLRRGATILMSQWVMHRDPRFWPAPEAFRPERWTAQAELQRPRYAYFPFGGGPRLCIGNHFAMMEIVLALAMIARQYKFTLAEEGPINPAPTFTLRPGRPILGRIVPRVAWASRLAS